MGISSDFYSTMYNINSLFILLKNAMLKIDYNVLFAVFVIVVLIVLFISWRFSKEKVWKKSYGIKKSIFTPTEFKFYTALNAFFGKHWLHSEYLVFSKIRLIDIFYADKKWNGAENRKMVFKILAKHIDFIITDKNWRPVLLIELDDPYHKWRNYYRSDELKNDICKHTWMPFERFNVTNYYNFDRLHNHL